MDFKANTFAGQLKHFAKSVDIVDDEIFEGARKLIYRYVGDELEAEYFEVDRAQEAEGETGLHMFWSSLDLPHVWRLQNADGSHVIASLAPSLHAADVDRGGRQGSVG